MLVLFCFRFSAEGDGVAARHPLPRYPHARARFACLALCCLLTSAASLPLRASSPMSVVSGGSGDPSASATPRKGGCKGICVLFCVFWRVAASLVPVLPCLACR